MSHLLLTIMNKENTCASIVLHVKTLHVLARTGIGPLTHRCILLSGRTLAILWLEAITGMIKIIETTKIKTTRNR